MDANQMTFDFSNYRPNLQRVQKSLNWYGRPLLILPIPPEHHKYYTCPYCEYETVQLMALKYHIMIHHISIRGEEDAPASNEAAHSGVYPEPRWHQEELETVTELGGGRLTRRNRDSRIKGRSHDYFREEHSARCMQAQLISDHHHSAAIKDEIVADKPRPVLQDADVDNSLHPMSQFYPGGNVFCENVKQRHRRRGRLQESRSREQQRAAAQNPPSTAPDDSDSSFTVLPELPAQESDEIVLHVSKEDTRFVEEEEPPFYGAYHQDFIDPHLVEQYNSDEDSIASGPDVTKWCNDKGEQYAVWDPEIYTKRQIQRQQARRARLRRAADRAHCDGRRTSPRRDLFPEPPQRTEEPDQGQPESQVQSWEQPPSGAGRSSSSRAATSKKYYTPGFQGKRS